MVNCPLGPDTHVKGKIEPYERLSFWFMDVPKGGFAEDTYLSASISAVIRVSGHQGAFLLTGCSDIPRAHFRLVVFIARFQRKGQLSKSKHTFTPTRLNIS